MKPNEDPIEAARLALIAARCRFTRLMCEDEPSEDAYQKAKGELEVAKATYENLKQRNPK